MPRPGKIQGPTDKANDLKKAMGSLLKYVRPYALRLIIVTIFAVGSTIFSIVGPKVLAKATDKLAQGVMAKVNNTGGIDFKYILHIAIILIVLYFISAFFSYIQGWIVSGVSQEVAYSLRKDLSEKMNRLPLSYFDKHASGDILSRVTNDIDTIAHSLNQSLSQMITSFTTVAGILIMMLSISWQMTLIALLILPLSLTLIALLMKKSQKYFSQQQTALGDVDGHIEEVYGGHLVVKAFNGEEEAIDKFNTYNASLYESAWKSQFFGSLMMPISQFVGNLGYVAVCIVGGYLATGKIITIGDIQAFVTYVRNFNQPISQLAQVLNLLQSAGAASERVFEFLEEKELDLEEAEVSSEDVAKMNGAVTFDHVQFGYNEDKIIINDFNLHVHAGQKVAIVGPTGAGKSTIIKLLMRFYELNKGSILIDGVDITKMKRSDLRSLFGMVLQDTWLFNGTIKDNLKYGALDASDDEIEEACQNAYAHHFIQTLPEGMDTVINEESSNISAGQKQLLTIARAFIKNPKILILDEATSSVDTRTELLIQNGMDKLMEGRTSFIIAHRLSTIRDANTIIVMKDGDIVEIGNHDTLLKQRGFYSELYESQFENA